MICPVGNCNNSESCSRLAMCVSQRNLHNGRDIAISRLAATKTGKSQPKYLGYDASTGDHIVEDGENLYRTKSHTNGTLKQGDDVILDLPYKKEGNITGISR